MRIFSILTALFFWYCCFTGSEYLMEFVQTLDLTTQALVAVKFVVYGFIFFETIRTALSRPDFQKLLLWFLLATVCVYLL